MDSHVDKERVPERDEETRKQRQHAQFLRRRSLDRFDPPTLLALVAVRLTACAHLRVDDDGRAHQRHESVIRQALDVDVNLLDVRHRHGDCHGDDDDPEHL